MTRPLPTRKLFVSFVVQNAIGGIHGHCDAFLDIPNQANFDLSEKDIEDIRFKLKEQMINESKFFSDQLIIITNWKWLSGGE